MSSTLGFFREIFSYKLELDRVEHWLEDNEERKVDVAEKRAKKLFSDYNNAYNRFEKYLDNPSQLAFATAMLKPRSGERLAYCKKLTEYKNYQNL